MNLSIKALSIRLLTLAALCLTAVACDNDNEEAPRGNYKSKTIDLSRSEMDASAKSNQFAWRLLNECMAETDDNIALSPFSANICLSMLANAAGGNSRDQLLTALDFEDQEMADVNSFNKKLVDNICNLDANIKLSVANSFWYDKKLAPKSAFLKDIKKNYDIESFVINPSTFGKEVNAWANDKTNGLIPRVVGEDIRKDFALMNAIYFKGIWSCDYKFDKALTKKDVFTNADGTESQIYYMYEQERYPYYCAEKWRAAMIPFGGGGFRFTVILPDEGSSIDECMESIRDFDPAIGKFDNRLLDFKLPKFKMQKETDLIEVLKRMGVTEIFDGVADFSNMTDYPVAVDLVKQNVSFEVNEEGAEAAAVTIVGGDLMDVGPKIGEYEIFHVKKPFIFMISESSTGAILFLGRINKF